MCETVKMSAVALRRIMAETFNYDKFKQGRQDARKFFKDHPEQREESWQRLSGGLRTATSNILLVPPTGWDV